MLRLVADIIRNLEGVRVDIEILMDFVTPGFEIERFVQKTKDYLEEGSYV